MQKFIFGMPTREEIAEKMDMNENELTEWEATSSQYSPTFDSIYDQFSIWFASDENTPEEEVNEVELARCC